MIKFTILLLLIASLYYGEIHKEKIDPFVFPFWQNMNLLNKFPFKSEDHHAYVDIYVNDLAKEPYIKESENFPVGSIIVKPIYFEQKRKDIARLMIMMKMKNGYDSKNNDWWYGVYDESGMIFYKQGKIVSCITCHEVVRDTDYIFSESVMHKISLQPILRNFDDLDDDFDTPINFD